MRSRQTNGRRHSPKCLCFGLAVFCTAALTAFSRYWWLQAPNQVLDQAVAGVVLSPAANGVPANIAAGATTASHVHSVAAEILPFLKSLPKPQPRAAGTASSSSGVISGSASTGQHAAHKAASAAEQAPHWLLQGTPLAKTKVISEEAGAVSRQQPFTEAAASGAAHELPQGAAAPRARQIAPAEPASEAAAAAATADDVNSKYLAMWHWAADVTSKEPLIQPSRICRNNGTLCLRGVVATRDIQAGEVIAAMPQNYTIELPEATANAWLERLHGDPAFNATFSTFVALLPTSGEVLIPDTMSDEELAMLQGGPMEAKARLQREGVRAAYNLARADPASWPARLNLSFAGYAHSGAVVKTRFWNFDKGSDSSCTMVPLLELANHNEPGIANAHVMRAADRSQVVMTAVKNISAADEVSIAYLWNRLHRADNALLEYGFVQQGRRPPLLVTHDHGGPGSEDLLQRGWFFDSPPDDSAYEPNGTLATALELRKLVDTLKAFPTSETEDWKQLQEEGHRLTWRQQLLLQFRIERKAALSFIATRLADALAAETGPSMVGDLQHNFTSSCNTTGDSCLLRFKAFIVQPQLLTVAEALLARRVATTAAYDLQLPPAPPAEDMYWLRAAALLQGGVEAAAVNGTSQLE